MACGCKNKTANTGGVVKTSSSNSQESKPQKTSNSGRIIKREIR
jgi:hypothetical protein